MTRPDPGVRHEPVRVLLSDAIDYAGLFPPAQLDMSRQAVTKHLVVLEAANLVVTVWRGREKLHYLNPEPIEAIADRWIGKYERRRIRALRDLKQALEEKSDE